MCFSKIKIVEKKDWTKLSKFDKGRVVAAIIFLIGSLYIFLTLSSPIIGSYQEINKLYPKQRSFELPIRINLNGTAGFDVDISFSLNFTYHNGTLIVDEPIDISSYAVFLSKNAENVETVQLGIQNSIAYNKTTNSIIKDYYGVPENGYLLYNSSQSGILYPYVLAEPITVIWTIDGTYHPIFAFKFKDGTKPLVMLIEDATITVYPKEQLTQIKAVEVNIRLSFAVFVLSIFNIIVIVLEILPLETTYFHVEPEIDADNPTQREPDEEKPDKQEPQEQTPSTEQELPKEEKE